MNFVFPGFLFALFAISIPVIIHLFRFRRFRTVLFPNVAFLRQLSEASDKESRLKHLLILLSRILAIAFLVMAFAKPYIPAEGDYMDPAGNATGIYIDNSFSMDALSARGTLLDEARERALEIASLYGPADRFLLLTNDFEGRHQRFVSREEFTDLVREIEPGARVRTIGEVMVRKEELFANAPFENHKAYFISDYQKSTSGLEELYPEIQFPASLIPLPSQEEENLFVDSCWFETPVRLTGEPITLHVRIRNDGNRNLENQPLRLFIDGQQRSVVAFNVAAGGETEVQLSWSAGSEALQQGYVETVDYPVTFDDRLYFTYTVSSEIPVLAIEGSGSNTYLRALYDRNELFRYRSMPAFSIDYSVFSDYPLILLNGLDRISSGLAMELQRFVNEGGHLAVFPGRQMDILSYETFLRSLDVDTYSRRDTTGIRVSMINEMHPLFDGVFEQLPENIDLPNVTSYYQIAPTQRSTGMNLLQLQNGLPFFASYRSGDGRVYLSAVPLDGDFSNFQRHSVFVPVLANIALHSDGLQALYHVIGPDMSVMMSGRSGSSDDVFILRRDDFEVIPEQRRIGNQTQLLFHDQMEEAGNYSLYRGEERVAGLSFNYDRRESLLEAYSLREIQDIITDLQLENVSVVEAGDKPLDQVLNEMVLGRQLWRLFLILALAFLFFEVMLLRFWK